MSSNEIAETEENINKVMTEYANMMAEDNKLPIVDIPSTVEEAKESGETFNDTTTIRDDLYNELTIPGGFHIAEDSGTKVEDGIVIEDEIENQFVWIPVGEYETTSGAKKNNLSRRTFTSSGATEVSGDNVIQQGSYNTYNFYGEGNENSVAKDQIEVFKASAIYNKGYYIGRYEAGTEVERTSASDSLTIPLVQKNKNAYVYVTRDQAKTQSEAMYNGNQFITSELISSYAWDTALNFMCQNSTYGYILATATSITYGNIGTNTRELTGAYTADCYSNINDLLGNFREWTTEYCSGINLPCVGRGGNYGDIYDSAVERANYNVNGSHNFSSFRIQLYIK